IHGWSFPQRAVTSSPLASHRLERESGVNLGLLHCDRDQHESRYAPVATSALQDVGLDGWLLGHVHRPDALRNDDLLGYLGSATGLHPGEYGARGPWLISITNARLESVVQWEIAPLHWERVFIDVTGISAPE